MKRVDESAEPHDRRNVANRLRVIGMDQQDPYMLSEVVESVTGDWRTSATDLAWRLASLIDPTCHAGHYCDDVLECEACGAIFDEWMDGGKRPSYCPMCGRRIEWED